MNIKELKSNEIMPGFHGRILHGSDFTWVYWEIDKGSSLPEHNHVNEQLMHVVKGKFEFTINGKKHYVKRVLHFKFHQIFLIQEKRLLVVK